MKKLLTNIFLCYLRAAAKIQLFKIRPKIIAITGSVGKTSLMNACQAVLKDHFKVKTSIKANSETGIPLSLFGLEPKNYSWQDWLRLSFLIPIKLLTNWQKYDWYIAELGIDDPLTPKNMEYLLKFIHPQISIFLNVAPVHTQQFEKIIPKNKKFKSAKEKQDFLLKAIAKEKGRIITSLDKDKIAIVNFDDKLVLEQAEKSKAKIYLFGKKVQDSLYFHPLDLSQRLTIQDCQTSLKGSCFKYQYKKDKFKIRFNYLLPEYYGFTFGPVIMVGLILGLNLKQIKKSLTKNFVLPSSRMNLFKGIKKTTIIDSSYNASRVSTIGALDLLKKLKTRSEKIFVFGDMRELGGQAEMEHKIVAKKIAEAADKAILIGPLTREYIFPITSIKIPTWHFENSWQAADWLKNNLKGQEIILVKGSQNTIFTEIIVESLLADKKDIKKLCRRGRFWDKQRKYLV